MTCPLSTYVGDGVGGTLVLQQQVDDQHMTLLGGLVEGGVPHLDTGQHWSTLTDHIHTYTHTYIIYLYIYICIYIDIYIVDLYILTTSIILYYSNYAFY